MKCKYSVLMFFSALFLMVTINLSQAKDFRIVTDCFGCSDRDYFEKLVKYIVQKDEVAFKNGLAVGIVTGKCAAFNVGEEVFLVDTAVFSGLVKIRKKGQTGEFWTNTEAVK